MKYNWKVSVFYEFNGKIKERFSTNQSARSISIIPKYK